MVDFPVEWCVIHQKLIPFSSFGHENCEKDLIQEMAVVES